MRTEWLLVAVFLVALGVLVGLEPPTDEPSSTTTDSVNVSDEDTGSPLPNQVGETEPKERGNCTWNPSKMAGVRNGSEQEPTERRYVNSYEGYKKEPNWVPEENVSMDEDVGVMYEVTRYPKSNLTSENLEAAWKLYNRSYEAAEENGWFNASNGLEDGYVPIGSHYLNPDYLLSNDSLSPSKPENLIYYDNPENRSGKVLAGIMFEHLGKGGNQVAGPLTVWHYHYYTTRNKSKLRYEHVITQGTEYESFEEVYRGRPSVRDNVRKNLSGEMIHLWFIKHPGGPFSSSMSFPPERLKQPEKMSECEFKRYTFESYVPISE